MSKPASFFALALLGLAILFMGVTKRNVTLATSLFLMLSIYR